MDTGWKSLAWSAIAILLLLSIGTPMSVFLLFLVAVPFVVLSTSLGTKSFILHSIVIFVGAYFLSPHLNGILFLGGMTFFIPAVVMGFYYKNQRLARQTIAAGFFTLLTIFLMELFLLSMFYNLDFRTPIKTMLTEQLQSVDVNVIAANSTPESVANALTDTILQMMPMVLLTCTFLITIVIHALSRWALNALGIKVPGLPLLRTLRLPRILLVYFIILLLGSYLLDQTTMGFWYAAVMNLVLIFEFLFSIQTMGVLFFVAHNKNWPKFLPVLLSIFILLIPGSFMIGVLDTAFPLRKFFAK